MMTIHKYPINNFGASDFTSHQSLSVKHIGIQRGQVYVWVFVDTESGEQKYRVTGLPTGMKIDQLSAQHIGTLMLNGGEFVAHYFLEHA